MKALVIVEMEIGAEDDKRPTLISESLQAVYAAGGSDAIFHVLMGPTAYRITNILHNRVPS